MTNPLALIIEDDVNLGEIFSKALENADFETELIPDGAIAQKRLQEVIPAIILLDMHLPNVSGKVLLSQIKSDERLAKTHIILASADAAMVDALQEDADLVLVKPVSFRHLRDLAQRFRMLC